MHTENSQKRQTTAIYRSNTSNTVVVPNCCYVSCFGCSGRYRTTDQDISECPRMRCAPMLQQQYHYHRQHRRRMHRRTIPGADLRSQPSHHSHKVELQTGSLLRQGVKVGGTAFSPSRCDCDIVHINSRPRFHRGR